MVTDGRQLKAGRVILGMTVNQMARAAGINRNSVLRVEKFGTLPHSSYAADRIKAALESLGIVFTIQQDGKAGVLFTAACRRRKNPYQRKR